LINTFDAYPLKEAVIDDISLRLFDEYRNQTINAEIIASNNRTTEEKLASLRCFDLKAKAPTIAGILLFGKNPRHFLPGAYIQFLRLPRTALTEIPRGNSVPGFEIDDKVFRVTIRRRPE
jgi:ATP-dependent DNA helicase RecG